MSSSVLAATPEALPAVGPPVRVRRRISATRSGLREFYAASRVNPKEAEDIAMLFERTPEQGRVAISVAQFQGYEAPGVDLLSFASAEVLERFKVTRDPLLVERFIEVKGRGQSQRLISLRGNEKKAAEGFRQRYFLYRIYKDLATQEYHLVIVQNPVEGPVETVYEVNPFNYSAAQGWTLKWEQPAQSDR